MPLVVLRLILLLCFVQLGSPALAAEKVFSAEQILTALFGPTRAVNPRERSVVSLPTVTYEFNSDKLTDQGKHQLNELAKAFTMVGLKERRITVAGHTDGRGKPEYNQKLSARRAEAARAYLVGEHGLPSDAVRSVGYGMSRLLKDRPKSAPEQRRVEVIVEPAS